MTMLRVAITGYMHEVNAFAVPITRRHGVQVIDSHGGLAETWEAGAAIRRLRELRDVEIMELPVWEFGASGPLDDADFTTVTDEVAEGVHAAGPVDGVLVLGHGAGRTDTDLDADGTFLRAVRDVVGPDVPVVVVLDFHANVSPAMCDLADVLVGYRTNPHVDIEERSIEAADHLHRLLDGGRTVRALSRPPLLLPQLAQNTTPGEPLAEVVALAERAVGGAVLNVSVFGGFSLADVPDCGLTVVVTADATAVEAADTAATIAAGVAERAWVLRNRYRTQLTPLADAVLIAQDAVIGRRSPVVLADTADNPGGGAPGNATFVLEALLAAGLDRTVATSHHPVAVLGLHCDRAVVDVAWEAGEGAQTRVEFNAGSADPLARPLTVDATVLCLQDGPLVPTTGVYRGMERHPGRCCALQIGGVAVAVSSHKVQCADDDTLLHVGLDPRHARVTVVKSRGHFRAGFAHLVADDQIVEVGAPGVAPAVFDDIAFRNISRPVVPLDMVDVWVPAATLHGATVPR